MIVSINQPAYLPWLGYFHRIAISDVHIILDHVQFEKNSYTNRNKIRTKDGWRWITVPVRTKGLFGNLEINTLKIVENNKWKKKHCSTIEANYVKADYFKENDWLPESISNCASLEFNNLIKRLTHQILNVMNINTKILYSSDLCVDGVKDELIFNLCKKVGATIYISGPFGRSYLDENRFKENGIQVVYHDYHHPRYPQVYSGFEPYMSIIDLLFNCGPKSFDIMTDNQQTVV